MIGLPASWNGKTWTGRNAHQQVQYRKAVTMKSCSHGLGAVQKSKPWSYRCGCFRTSDSCFSRANEIKCGVELENVNSFIPVERPSFHPTTKQG